MESKQFAKVIYTRFVRLILGKAENVYCEICTIYKKTFMQVAIFTKNA